MLSGLPAEFAMITTVLTAAEKRLPASRGSVKRQLLGAGRKVKASREPTEEVLLLPLTKQAKAEPGSWTLEHPTISPGVKQA